MIDISTSGDSVLVSQTGLIPTVHSKDGVKYGIDGTTVTVYGDNNFNIEVDITELTLEGVAPQTDQECLDALALLFPYTYSEGGGSGGIQSIVAGDNITVDDTDPLNPIVSASEGGLPTLSLYADDEEAIAAGLTTGQPYYKSDGTVWAVLPPTPQTISLLYDDILNVPVADPNSLSDWNTYFSLPANGTPFTSVMVSGNEVVLTGIADISISSFTSTFISDSHILSINDSGCIVYVGNDSMYGCTNLVNLLLYGLLSCGEMPKNCPSLDDVEFPLLTDAANMTFTGSQIASILDLSSVLNLGPTVGDDGVFVGVSGNTFELYVPAALMTCNGGNPDGDIQYLQANNTVTVIMG